MTILNIIAMGIGYFAIGVATSYMLYYGITVSIWKILEKHDEVSAFLEFSWNRLARKSKS